MVVFGAEIQGCKKALPVVDCGCRRQQNTHGKDFPHLPRVQQTRKGFQPMKEYSTSGPKRQEGKTNKRQQSTTKILWADPDTGEAVELEPLRDDKFPWQQRKLKGLDLATLYRTAKLPDKAEKVLSCSTWLQYLATPDDRRQLHHFNACKNRLCPICNKRKAKRMAAQLLKVLDKVQADHKGTQLIFLTLTLRNCEGDKLRATLDELTPAWFRLIRRRPFARAVRGWFRAIEITYNEDADTYHPHIHAILVVENAYFYKNSPLYLTQPTWEKMWRESLRVNYNPRVDVRSTYGKGGKTRKAKKERGEVLEAAKYATKDSDFLNPRMATEKAAEIVATYDAALHRKRLTAMGGWVKEAAAALAVDVEDDSDLVHDTDGEGELTAATAELLEDYGWHFGVSQHVLMFRQNNPDYQGGSTDDMDDGPGDA